MPSPTAEEVHAEIVAGKVAAADALPRLVAKRAELEKEAGALAVANQKRSVFLIVCGSGAVLAGLYSLGIMVVGSGTVVGWVVTVCLAILASFIASSSKRRESERTRYLEELSSKMLTIGRRIDSATRTLRR